MCASRREHIAVWGAREAGPRPGRYLAVAVPRDSVSLTDASAAYFDLLSKHGSPVEISDREANGLDLKLTAVR
jgi:hypothetical protein